MMQRIKKGYLIVVFLILLLVPSVMAGIANDHHLIEGGERTIGSIRAVEIGPSERDNSSWSVPETTELTTCGMWSESDGRIIDRSYCFFYLNHVFDSLDEDTIFVGLEEDTWKGRGCYIAADTSNRADTYTLRGAAALAKQGTIINNRQEDAATLDADLFLDTMRSTGMWTGAGGTLTPQSPRRLLTEAKVYLNPNPDEIQSESLCYDRQWVSCGGDLERYPVLIRLPEDGPDGEERYTSFMCTGAEWMSAEEYHQRHHETELAGLYDCQTNKECEDISSAWTCHDNICLNTRAFKDVAVEGVTCPFSDKVKEGTRDMGGGIVWNVCILDEDNDDYNVVNLLSPDGTGPGIDCIDDPATDPGRTDTDKGICGSVTQEMCRSDPAAYSACAACTNPGMPDFIGDAINNNCRGEAVADIDELDQDGDRWLAWTETEMLEEYRSLEELQSAVIGDVVHGIEDCVNSGEEFEDRYPDVETRTSFLDTYGPLSARDAAGAINPGAVEACDLVDNDCDGGIDEGCVADESQSMCERIEGDTWIASETGGGSGCCGNDYPGSLENFGVREATTAYAACLNSVPVANDGTGGRDLVPDVATPPELWNGVAFSDDEFAVFNTPSLEHLRVASVDIPVPRYLLGRNVKFSATVVAASSEETAGIVSFEGVKHSAGSITTIRLAEPINIPITRGMEKTVSAIISLPPGTYGSTTYSFVTKMNVIVTRPTLDTIIKIKDIHIIVEEEAKVLYSNNKFYACTPSDDIRDIKLTTPEGIIPLPIAPVPLIDADDYRDACDNVGSWYCSIGSTDELSIWKQAPDSETPHDTVKYIPAVKDDAKHGIEGPERGCCPSNMCWKGTSCNPHDADNPSRTTGLNLLNGNTYVCDAGPAGGESAVWKPAEEKTDQFGKPGGVCSWDQCYYNDGSISRKDDDKCVRDEFIPPTTLRNPDAICNKGEWKSRTMLLARNLLSVDFSTNDYSLSCGEPNDVLLRPIPEALINCGGAPCVERACVLRSKDNIVLGFVLNNPLDAAYELEPAKFDSSFLKAFGKDEFEVTTDAVAAGNQHYKYCDNVIIAGENEYAACSEDERLRYNPVTKSILFSENEISFTSSILAWLKVSLLGKDILKDIPSHEQSMSKLYSSSDGIKQISGAVYLAGGAERMIVEYNNTNDNVCEPLDKIALECRPYAMPSSCFWGIFCSPRWQFKAETSTSLEWWNDLTAKTRMPGTTWAPVERPDKVATSIVPSRPIGGEIPIDGSLPLDALRTGSTDIGGGGLGDLTGRVVQSLDKGGLPFITGRASSDAEKQSVMENEVVDVAVTLMEDELDAVAYTIDFGDKEMISVTSPEGLSPAPQHSYTLPDSDDEKEYTVNLRVLKEDGSSFTVSSRTVLEVLVKRDAKDIDYDGDGQTFNEGDACEDLPEDLPTCRIDRDCSSGLSCVAGRCTTSSIPLTETVRSEPSDTSTPELQSSWFLEQCLDGIDNNCNGETDEAACFVIPPRGAITPEWGEGTLLPTE